MPKNKNSKTLREEDFDKKYTLSKKHKSENFNHEDGDIGRFETFGKDLDIVLKVANKNPKRVWTCVDGDDGMYWIAGYHIVNRVYYLITNQDWDNENEQYLIDEY